MRPACSAGGAVWRTMSIYATLWTLMFPRFGDFHSGHDWVAVRAQGVPSHIGTPSPGHGYERGDPYGDFLPPPLRSWTCARVTSLEERVMTDTLRLLAARDAAGAASEKGSLS